MTNQDLRRAVGQVLIGGFRSTSVEESFAEMVSDGCLGGTILFSRNFSTIEQARDLVVALTSLTAPERLLIAIDQEGGRVQRLPAPFPQIPSMRSFGEIGRKTISRRAGLLLGESLRLFGIHQNFAPVLDLNASNEEGDVIGDRAFSDDPGLVSRLGASFIDGLQSTGVAACAKHFPGHPGGESEAFVHLPDSMAHILFHHVSPFLASVHISVASIMVGHIVIDALDPDLPAPFNEKAIDILRNRLRYEGVVVCDDLSDQGILDQLGVEEAAVKALAAGCDQLLICHDESLCHLAYEGILHAVEQGKLPKDRVLEAAARVTRLKEEYVFPAPPPVEGDIALQLPTEPHEALLFELENPVTDPPKGQTYMEVQFDFEGDPNLELELDE